MNPQLLQKVLENTHKTNTACSVSQEIPKCVCVKRCANRYNFHQPEHFCYDALMEDLRSLLLFHLAVAFDQQDRTPQGFDYVIGATRHTLSYPQLNWRLQPFSSNSIRSAVSLMQREGLLTTIQQEGKSWVRMTAAGREKLFSSIPSLARKKRWDGSWRVVVFSGVRHSDDSAQAYRTIRTLLTKHDFAPLERGVYLSPFPLEREVLSELESIHAMGMLTVVETRKFLIGDEQDFARQAWDLDQLSKTYTKLSKSLQGLLTELTAKKDLHEGQKAQFFRYAEQFLSVSHQDPALPSQVMGKDESAKECAELFAKLSAAIIQLED